MEIDVIYKYRAPGAPMVDATTIATDTVELENPGDVLKTPLPVGERVTLQPGGRGAQGEAPKEYRIVDRSPILARFGEAGFTLSMLVVVVTDPE